MNLSWKRTISIAFSVFTLFVGSIGLVGCDEAGEVEQEGVELEEEGDGVEVEEE